ncbi:MAG: hypothetical protein RIK87_05835 [Fuerstiella sp.]
MITAMAYLATWALFFEISLQSRRQKAVRFFAVNSSLVLAIVGVELSAMMIDYRHLFGRQVQPWENTKNLLDRELIHIHRPNYRATGQLTGGDLSRRRIGAPALTVRPYDVAYDRHGFRNDVNYDRVDCIVIGDSFVEAGNVLSDELSTHRIASETGLLVANLGQSYYGPQQELEVLKRFGLPLQPRICVWLFFEGNDLGDVWRYQEFASSWPRSVANYSSWKERSFTRNAFTWIATKFKDSTDLITTERSGLFSASTGQQRLWFGYSGLNLGAREKEAIEITAASISEAYALCRQRDIQFIFAFAPTKYRVYSDLCGFDEDSPIQGWTVNTLPEQLAETIRAISGEIEFLDLTTSLRDAAMTGQLVYYADDTHWSPEGHAIVGRAISNVILAQTDVP